MSVQHAQTQIDTYRVGVRDLRVVRDDLEPGGSKTRFLPALLANVSHVVYGAPFCGGAPVALAAVGRALGIRVTIFYAQRDLARLHTRQQQVLRLGAEIVWVPMGFMSHVQSRVKAYARETGACALPLGFDTPAAYPIMIDSIRATCATLTPRVREVWCAASTGMLTACLARALPDATIHAVTVGAASYRTDTERFPANITWHASPYKYEQPCRTRAPFPVCAHYEAKAWEIARAHAAPDALFWNVIGDH